MAEQFDGKVVIVTGGATGIGKEVTVLLLQRGAKVAACSRNEKNLQRLQEAHTEGKGELFTIPCDVSRADDVRRLVSAVVKRFDRIDCLVNNAGQFPVTPSLEVSEEEWDRVIDTNLKGPFMCTTAVVREMIAQGVKGCIVNISSTASLVARPGVVHYACSKAGLNMLTKALAVEFSPHGIRVNAVLPGLILTEAVQAMLTSEEGRVEHQTKVARIPIGSEGKPEDIANAILHLLSEESKYTTGSLLVVDGGYSLGIPAYRA
jgi:NAD(P)-dependent dehydrogenase (short-subunit alcohol dehydrogenase family)